MDNNFTLKNLLDHLNTINSSIMIVHFETETGLIRLSNNNAVDIKDLNAAADIEKYL